METGRRMEVVFGFVFVFGDVGVVVVGLVGEDVVVVALGVLENAAWAWACAVAPLARVEDIVFGFVEGIAARAVLMYGGGAGIGDGFVSELWWLRMGQSN